MKRRHVTIPDDLDAKIEQAAADESAKQGRTVSVSEWVRGVFEQAVK